LPLVTATQGEGRHTPRGAAGPRPAARRDESYACPAATAAPADIGGVCGDRVCSLVEHARVAGGGESQARAVGEPVVVAAVVEDCDQVGGVLTARQRVSPLSGQAWLVFWWPQTHSFPFLRTCVRMTSDGSAIVRLKRALANERCTATQIRALDSGRTESCGRTENVVELDREGDMQPEPHWSRAD